MKKNIMPWIVVSLISFFTYIFSFVAAQGWDFVAAYQRFFSMFHLRDERSLMFFMGMHAVAYVFAALAVLIVWRRFRHDNAFKRMMMLFGASAALQIIWGFGIYQMIALDGDFFIVFGALLSAVCAMYLLFLLFRRSVLAWFIFLPYALWVFYLAMLSYLLQALKSFY